MQLDHVAILVEDIEATLDAWSLPDAQEIETFPREGTRELYCGAAGRSGRVLLMQPIGPGPYERAMAKRGPGLHHVALCVLDLIEFVTGVAGSGWLLHPKSLDTYETNRQAWLCRPGFPCLVELNGESVAYEGVYAQEVALSVSDAMEPMIDRLGCEEFVGTQGARPSMVIGGRRIWIGDAGASQSGQVSHVLAGGLTFRPGDTDLQVKAGDTVRIPGRFPYRVVAHERSRLLDVFSLPRKDLLEAMLSR